MHDVFCIVYRYSSEIESGNVRVAFLVYDASGVYITIPLDSDLDLLDQIGKARFLGRTDQTDNAIGK